MKDVKSLLSQCHPVGKGKLTLLPEEWATICLLVEVNLNHTPYRSNSIVTPESLINPKAVAKHFVIPHNDNGHDSLRMQDIAESM